MREFGLSFTDGLLRGLRAFPTPRSGQEELIECHNLMPSDHSLRGHVALTPLGITAPFVEYFAIKDQGDVTWYWVASSGLDTIYDTAMPALSAMGFTILDMTPAIVPSWLQIDAADSVATQLYVFPSEITGDLLVDTSAPAIGTGYDVGLGLDLRSLSGWKHRLSALTTLDTFWRRLGE